MTNQRNKNRPALVLECTPHFILMLIKTYNASLCKKGEKKSNFVKQ